METIRELGSGKLATVTECRTAQGKRVAVKQFNRKVLENAHTCNRLVASAQTWKSLKHEGLVEYSEVNPEQGQIVMELMPRSVASRIRGGPSEPPVAWTTLRQALKCLEFLHSKGLIHGNLKPTNIFFGHESEVLLSDGLLINSANSGTLPPPTTQKYLSPEETNDVWGELSPATDLYCLGFVVLELLAGERFSQAFQGVGDADEHDLAWFQWHASLTAAPSAKLFHSLCPSQLTAVLSRLLAKDPSKRFRTASQVLHEMPEQMTANETKDGGIDVVEHTPSLEHIIKRPHKGVVFCIASGPRAGEMYGTDADQVGIGYSPDSTIAFDSEMYPHSRAQVNVVRRQSGWVVERVAGDMLFVNCQELLDDQSLRSGDILRLSARGPDVQFTLQSGGKSISELTGTMLPKPDKAAAVPQKQQPARPQPAEVGSSALRSDASTNTTATAASTLASNVARSKTPSNANRAARSPSAAPTERSAPVSIAPSAPSSPSITSYAPTRPTSPNTEKADSKSSDGKSPEAFKLLAPRSWTKSQKKVVNMVIVIVGLVLLAAIALIPWSPDDASNQPMPSPPEESRSLEVQPAGSDDSGEI